MPISAVPAIWQAGVEAAPLQWQVMPSHAEVSPMSRITRIAFSTALAIGAAVAVQLPNAPANAHRRAAAGAGAGPGTGAEPRRHHPGALHEVRIPDSDA